MAAALPETVVAALVGLQQLSGSLGAGLRRGGWPPEPVAAAPAQADFAAAAATVGTAATRAAIALNMPPVAAAEAMPLVQRLADALVALARAVPANAAVGAGA